MRQASRNRSAIGCRRRPRRPAWPSTTATKFPEWRGQVFVGALAGRTLWRLQLDAAGSVVLREEVAALKAAGYRIRDVRQGPDGWIYLLSDEGSILRLERDG